MARAMRQPFRHQNLLRPLALLTSSNDCAAVLFAAALCPLETSHISPPPKQKVISGSHNTLGKGGISGNPTLALKLIEQADLKPSNTKWAIPAS